MSFKLVISDTVTVPVKGTIPNAAGAPQAFSYSLVCERLKADTLRAMMDANERTVPEFLAGVVSDWAGVLDDDGQPLPFNHDGLAALFNIVGMAGVAFAAYLEACGARGKEKN